MIGFKPTRPGYLKHLVPDNSRFYAHAVVIKVLLDKVAPDSDWARRLKYLLDEHPEAAKNGMGFPDEWETTRVWVESL